MDITFKCYHCGKEIPDAGSILNHKKYARPTLETSGKRTFVAKNAIRNTLKIDKLVNAMVDLFTKKFGMEKNILYRIWKRGMDLKI